MILLDSVVRSALLNEQLTIHYYIQFLHAGLNGLRSMNLDVTGTVKTVTLTVDTNNEAELPSGFIDFIKIGYRRYGYIIPMAQNKNYNSLPSIAGNNQVPYQIAASNTAAFSPYGFWDGYVNQYGEDLGRLYGTGGGTRVDEFKILPNRNKILCGAFVKAGDEIVVEYIGEMDFLNEDAIVHPYAVEALEAYIKYEYAKARNSRKNLTEIEMCHRDFVNKQRIMRARRFAMTAEEWRRLDQDHTKMSVK
jgi:hypothetical protein